MVFRLVTPKTSNERDLIAISILKCIDFLDFHFKFILFFSAFVSSCDLNFFFFFYTKFWSSILLIILILKIYIYILILFKNIVYRFRTKNILSINDTKNHSKRNYKDLTLKNSWKIFIYNENIRVLRILFQLNIDSSILNFHEKQGEK